MGLQPKHGLIKSYSHDLLLQVHHYLYIGNAIYRTFIFYQKHFIDIIEIIRKLITGMSLQFFIGIFLK